MNRLGYVSFLFVLFARVEASHAVFVNGDLVILTTADNASTAASAITLNDYAYNPSTGTFGTTPTSHAISGLTLPGLNDHDGMLHMSTNGSSLVFGGYEAAVGTPSVIASGATRAIGVVNSSWNLTTAAISDYTGVALRSVVSTDGQHFWTGGDQGTDGGQYYVDASGNTVTQTLITANDARSNRIVDGQLWGFSSSNAGTTIGAGLPTTAATATLAMNSPFVKSDAIFLDSNNDGTSDVAYSTDGKNLIGKWNLENNVWTLTGQWSGSKSAINNINSLEAFFFNGKVELLAATQTGQLFQFTDANGSSPNFDSAFLNNTSPSPFLTVNDASFRGMAITVPEPTTITLLAVAIPLLAWHLRRRAR
jgi:hypothetical protein